MDKPAADRPAAVAHILVIEDDPAVAQGLQDGLQREGYRVTWKSSGLEAIRYAQKTPPQLILLDVRLPDGSGFDFCRQMRHQGMRLPILMLTVEQEEMDKVLGLEMGADDYITKPFSLREKIELDPSRPALLLTVPGMGYRLVG